MIIRRDTDDLANIFIIWLYNPNSWITIHVDILKHFKPLIFFFFPSQNLLIVLRDIEQINLSYFLKSWCTFFRMKNEVQTEIQFIPEMPVLTGQTNIEIKTCPHCHLLPLLPQDLWVQLLQVCIYFFSKNNSFIIATFCTFFNNFFTHFS